MEIQFEKFNYPVDLAEQRKLFIECFPENIGTPIETTGHYKWKFKSFPTKGSQNAYEYIAKLDNELIGYYAAIPYEYYIQGKPVRIAMVCDVMTGVKARGKGVFTKLGVYSTDQFKQEGLAFSTGYPIRPEVIPGHKKAGWDFPFQIPMYGKFLKFNTFFKTRKKNYLTPFANFTISIYNGLLSLLIQKSKSITAERYNANQLSEISGFDDFSKKWCSENQIALNKNIEFYNWRLGAPEKKYEIIVLRDNQSTEIQGYAIVRAIKKEGVPCLGVLDFNLLNKTQHHSKRLLWEIDQCAKRMKAELILMMMMRPKAKSFKVQQTGFFKTPFPFSFIIKQFDKTIDANFLKDENNWSLMWIDSDDL